MIHQDESAAVFGAIDALLDELGPVPAYRAVFDTALTKLRESAEQSSVFLPIDLPLAAAGLLDCSPEVAIASAAASTLLWSGADLMDDVADGELAETWREVSPSRIALVSTNLLSTLPHLLAGRVGSAETAASYSQAASRTLFVMSEGQAADLQSADSVLCVEDYLDVVRRKTGAEFALFASTPAILSERDDETVGAWTRFGFAYGTMVQVLSDTFSTIAESPRSDLLLGKRTLPVLLTLRSMRDLQHSSFVADLDLASQGDHAAASRAVDAMAAVGAIRESLENCELLRFRASQALPVALAELSADHPIRTMLRIYSLV